MKKLVALVLAAMVLLSVSVALADVSAKVGDGVVTVTVTKPCRIAIKSGDSEHYFDVEEGQTVLPLTFGGGKYSVTEYFHHSGRKWKKGKSVSFSYNGDGEAAYRQPNFVVNYNEEGLAAQKASELCATATTDKEKANIIYKWMIHTFTYDYVEAAQLVTNSAGRYSVNADEVLLKQSGVCYDLSALFVAMCRSQGLTARLEIGDGHAWAVVVIDGKEAIADIASKLQTGNSKASGFSYEAKEVF